MQVKPTHVLNAAGLTGRPNVDWCETHRVRHRGWRDQQQQLGGWVWAVGQQQSCQSALQGC